MELPKVNNHGPKVLNVPIAIGLRVFMIFCHTKFAK